MASIWNFIEVTPPGAVIQPSKGLLLGLARELAYDTALKSG